MSFAVLLDNFQGPLDLLLQLTERAQLDIKEVSLSTITASYLDHIRSIDIDPDEVNTFITIATQLVFYKSKKALPDTSQMPEEDTEEDSAEDLARRLERYKFYRQLGQELGQRSTQPFIARPQDFVLPKTEDKRKLATSPEYLRELWQNVASKASQTRPSHNVRLRPLALAEVMTQMIERLQAQTSTSLEHILAFSRDKHEALLMFLAILELARSRKLACELHENELTITPYRVEVATA